MLDELKKTLELKKDEIIKFLINKDYYPYVCDLSYTYIYDMLKNNFEVYRCSGDFERMFHCWNEVVVLGETVVIDFTRVQFDLSELREGSFSDYTDRIKKDYTLQKEYFITKEHDEFKKYISIFKE